MINWELGLGTSNSHLNTYMGGWWGVLYVIMSPHQNLSGFLVYLDLGLYWVAWWKKKTWPEIIKFQYLARQVCRSFGKFIKLSVSLCSIFSITIHCSVAVPSTLYNCESKHGKTQNISWSLNSDDLIEFDPAAPRSWILWLGVGCWFIFLVKSSIFNSPGNFVSV